MIAAKRRCRCGQPATELDHQPPITLHSRPHVDGSGCCVLLPTCALHARQQGGQLAHIRQGVVVPIEIIDEPVGLPVGHAAWNVPWLDELREVPAESAWPRLMTVPHPNAVGSLGAEAIAWVRAEMGLDLRHWQRLDLTRRLEHDGDGNLVWPFVLLTTARQVGKSTTLRAGATWRIHQTARWGEAQTVVHTGKDLPVCKEVQALARAWAKARGYPVREQNGNEQITEPLSGSRWIVRGKGSVYGYSASMVLADEAWGILSEVVDDGLEPTMLARRSPQIVLASTAHPRTTSLFPERRNAALDALQSPRSTLLVEWSAPRGCALDDEEAWRAASPFWDDGWARLIPERIARILAEGDDAESVDPEGSARAQVLNIWPAQVVPVGRGERLIQRGAWAALERPVESSVRRLWVAVENNFGDGGAVVAVAELADGRFEVDGWCCDRWETALAEGQAVLASQRAPGRLIVSAGIRTTVGQRAGATETRVGLPLVRSTLGRIVHDETPELEAQLDAVRVREVSGGLALLPGSRTDLVRALAWALWFAQAPAVVPVLTWPVSRVAG
jgi:hypothetical protein